VNTINPNSKEVLALRECRNCRHWWHDPLPRQEYLSSLYEDASAFVITKESLEISQTTGELKKMATAILSSLPKREGFNYLEIGVGSGQLFSIFKEWAEFCYGVEPGNWHEMDKNIVKDVDHLPKDIRFDVIVAYDVLEHLHSPVEMLKKLRKLANHGAVIHCSFPNRDSLQAGLCRGKWSMIRPVGHLHYFSSKSVRRMFERSDWILLDKRTCRPRNMSLKDVMRGLDLRTMDGSLVMTINLLLNRLLLSRDQWRIKGMAMNSD
jgi:SAM-dependent methyltransferase